MGRQGRGAGRGRLARPGGRRSRALLRIGGADRPDRGGRYSGSAPSCGLALAPERRPKLKADSARGTLHDSFAEFLGGVARFIENPYLRPLMLGEANRQDMDDSVGARFAGDPKYRPKNQGFPLH